MSNSQMKERRTELETRVRQLQAYHDKLEAQIASLTNPQGPTSSEVRLIILILRVLTIAHRKESLTRE